MPWYGASPARAPAASPVPLAAAVARAHGGAWLPQNSRPAAKRCAAAQVHLGGQIERLTDAYLGPSCRSTGLNGGGATSSSAPGRWPSQEEQLRGDAARRQQLAGLVASLEAFRERVQGGLAQASSSSAVNSCCY